MLGANFYVSVPCLSISIGLDKFACSRLRPGQGQGLWTFQARRSWPCSAPVFNRPSMACTLFLKGPSAEERWGSSNLREYHPKMKVRTMWSTVYPLQAPLDVNIVRPQTQELFVSLDKLNGLVSRELWIPWDKDVLQVVPAEGPLGSWIYIRKRGPATTYTVSHWWYPP